MAKVNRGKFLLHLERLLAGGQCTEVVFHDAFASNALTPDQMLCVIAPPIASVEGLAEDIGVSDVNLLIRALKALAGEGNIGVEVNIYVKDNRLIIDEKDRGVHQLLIAEPRTIATRIEQESIDEVLKDAPKKANGVALTRAIVEGVRNVFSLYKAEEVEIVVGTKGSKIIVGSDRTHRAEFPLDYKAKEGFTLVFGRHLTDVFSVISDYSSARLCFGSGPEDSILVEDAGYKYLLSPRIRGADDKSMKADEGEVGDGAGDDAGDAPAEAGTKAKAKPAPKKRGG